MPNIGCVLQESRTGFKLNVKADWRLETSNKSKFATCIPQPSHAPMEHIYKIENQNGIYFITFAVVEWVDVFTRSNYAEIVTESLAHCQKEKGLIIYAWCLMSNHIHLVCETEEGNELSAVLRDFKKYTARQIISEIHDDAESRKNWMLWLFRNAGEKNSNNKTFQFWQQNNHPIELFTSKFVKQKIRYVHDNPVRAGIVEFPEQYRYSSAKNYRDELGLLKVEVLPLVLY
jgi:putative transposase